MAHQSVISYNLFCLLTDENTVFAIVQKRNLWRFLVELIPLAPTDLSKRIVTFMFTNQSKLFEDVDFFLIVSLCLAVTGLVSFGPSDNDLEQFASTTCTPLVTFLLGQAEKEASTGHLLTALLFLMHCSFSETAMTNSLYFLTPGSMHKFYQKWPLKSTTSKSHPITTSLQAKLIDITNDLSVNDWLSFAEAGTEAFQENVHVRFWKEPSCFPSKLQYLIAHYAFECLPHIQDDAARERTNSLAKKYDCEIEMGLDDMTLDDVLHKAASSSGWQRQSCILYLINNHLQNTSDRPKVLNALLQYKEAATCITQIFEALLKESSDNSTVEAFFALFECAKPEECRKILKNYVAEHGPDNRLKSGRFQTQVQEYLNKIAPNDGDVKEGEEAIEDNLFMAIVIQDAPEFIRQLLIQAIDNEGKSRVFSDILSHVIMKHQNALSTTFVNQCALLFQEQNHNEEQTRNLLKIVGLVGRKIPELMAILVQELLSLLVSDDGLQWEQFLHFMNENLSCSIMGLGESTLARIGLAWCVILKRSSTSQLGKINIVAAMMQMCQHGSEALSNLWKRHLPPGVRTLYFSGKTLPFTLTDEDVKEENRTKLICQMATVWPILLPHQLGDFWGQECFSHMTVPAKVEASVEALMLLGMFRCVPTHMFCHLVSSLISLLDQYPEAASEANHVMAMARKCIQVHMSLPAELRTSFIEIPVKLFSIVFKNLTEGVITDVLVLIKLLPESEEKRNLLTRLKLDLPVCKP